MTSQDPVNAVFKNEMLREKILDSVIHEKDEVSYLDVRSFRLVNKAWMNTTAKCLRKCREPLFQLLLHEYNSVSALVGENENRKLLNIFLSSVTGASSPSEEQIPTFKLIASEDFFRQENHKSLLECFSRCGSSLVDFDIKFPKNGGSMTFTFPSIAFPKLVNFSIEFDKEELTELEEEETAVGNANGAYLMQLILSGCEDLQSLVIRYEDSMPYGIDRLVLPATLTSLDLSNFDSENKHWELLQQNEFPNLKKLSVTVGGSGEEPLDDGLVFKILEKVKTTLVHLNIKGTCHLEEFPKEPTYFQLPVMEQLEHFQSDSIHLELELGISLLQNCVPKLEKLSLDNHTAPMFERWTGTSKFDSVKELTVCLVDEDYSDSQIWYYIGFRSEMMRLVELTFPNLQTLAITVSGTELCGLKYAFKNLTRLQVLKVTAERCDGLGSADCWDTLLIGTPLEFGAALRTNRDFWSCARFGPSDDHPSIKNLTELQAFYLSASIQRTHPPPQPTQLTNSLISDVAFQFAFLEMPKLKRMCLHGRFMVSSAMKKKWTEQCEGRVFCYHK